MVWIAMAVGAVLVGSDGTYASEARVAYLRKTLRALESSERKTVEDTFGYIDVIDRNECRSAFARLRAQCLVEAAKRSCRGRRRRAQRQDCLLYSDVIVTNKLSEGNFLSTAERYMLMKRHRDYRHQLRAELRRRYGTLVTDLMLSQHLKCAAGDRDCLTAAIDAYCLEYADTRSLSWQHCAAAVIWFVGTAKEEGV
jgi:hypothetical protein